MVAEYYCPTCEPEADVLGRVLEVRWCVLHAPVARGTADDAIVNQAWISGSSEAGGEDNRLWCAFFHGGRR